MDGCRDTLNTHIASGSAKGAAAVAVQQGKAILEVYAGDGQAGRAMSGETVLLWLSSGKPLAATGIALLHERGHLHVEDTVASWIPHFGENGKQAITIRHLLTHTAGLHKSLPAVWEIPSWYDAVDRVCHAHAAFAPGASAAYDPSGAWFILGEIIQRAGGQSFEDFVGQHIFGPCEMNSASFTRSDGCASYWNTAGGKQHPLHWPNLSDFPRPGASFRATLGDMVRFYSGLLEGKIIGPETLDLFTHPARGKMPDKTFGVPLDWGLGFMVNNGTQVPYHFGLGASPRAFGHGGQQSSIALCDPATKTIIAAAYTGLPGEPAHHRRMTELLAAIWQELA